MKKLHFSLTLIFLLLLTGCGTFEIIVETPVASPPVFVDTQESTETSTPEPFNYDDLIAGSMLTPELAGMVFHDDLGVWVVDGSGQARLIGERINGPVLSPNGDQVLFTSEDETVLWLRDLPSGESRILDETPNRMKRGFSWWAERPGVIIYALVEITDPWMGTLGGMNVETGETFLLDSQSPTDYSLSTDGETLVLGARETLRITKWGGSTEIILPENFQMTGWSFSHPSWSPDGTKLSLFASRYNEASAQTEMAVTVLDLQTKQSTIIHSYQAPLGGEYPFTTEWSPDGQWISATTFGELGGRMPALWIFSADGTEQHQYPYGSGPVWSTDGSQLLYWQGPEPGGADSSYRAYSLNHISIGTWEAQPLEVAVGSAPEDWVSVP